MKLYSAEEDWRFWMPEESGKVVTEPTFDVTIRFRKERREELGKESLFCTGQNNEEISEWLRDIAETENQERFVWAPDGDKTFWFRVGDIASITVGETPRAKEEEA